MRKYNVIKSLFFPPTCYHCARLVGPPSFLCEECLSKIHWVEEPLCVLCGLPFVSSSLSHPCPRCLADPPLFDCHRSCVVYEEPVRTLIFRFKYNRQRFLSPLFGEWLWTRHPARISEADYLIPVPLYRSRLAHRTFNQSLELAKILSKKSGVPVLRQALIKMRKTPSQTGLTQKERRMNLEHAFEQGSDGKRLEGKKVLLIDDICSTGSTLSACAEVLRALKPASLQALTLAYNVGL